MTNYTVQLDHIFHALADPTRRAVVQELTKGPSSVKELAHPFDMALPSFMQHLRVLEKSGLIRSKKVGRVRTCEIVAAPLTEAEQWFAEQRQTWERRLDRFEQYIEELQEQRLNDKDES